MSQTSEKKQKRHTTLAQGGVWKHPKDRRYGQKRAAIDPKKRKQPARDENDERDQVRKGAGRMPWHMEPKKDVISCEKLRGVANTL